MKTKTKTLVWLIAVMAVFLIVTTSCLKKESTDTTPTNTDPYGMFQYTIKTNGIVSFTNTSTNATSYLWDFGDGNTSTETTLSFDHQYLQNGTYKATLTAYGNGKSSGAYANLTITNATNTFTIGQNYGGGIIFYINGTGQHGLIAAPKDQSDGWATWGCSGTLIETTSAGIGTGQSNTTAIVNKCSEAGIAARLCDTLTLNGYTDWYLPSQDELNQMYLQKAVIGNMRHDIYWSSTEDGLYAAYYQFFGDGLQSWTTKDVQYFVRAIRSF